MSQQRQKGAIEHQSGHATVQKKAVVSQTTTCAILTLKLHLQFNLSQSMLTHGSHMKMAPSPRIHKKREKLCPQCLSSTSYCVSSLHTDQQITAVKRIK